MLLQRPLQKDRSRRFIALHCDEGREELALVVYSPPRIMPIAVDLDEHLSMAAGQPNDYRILSIACMLTLPALASGCRPALTENHRETAAIFAR